MPIRLLGLHHVTATVDDAQTDLDFFRDTLGLRLVKRTVNFDNHNVFHFYYGDESGTPGTIWTTFPYRGWGVRVGSKGAGQIVTTAFSVPRESLRAWEGRLAERGVPFERREPRFGDEVLAFQDPSGLQIELIATPDARAPWIAPGLTPANAIRGLNAVTLLIKSPPRSIALLTEVLGFAVVGEENRRTRLSVNGSGAGRSLDILADEQAAPAINGTGTVHHVAFAIENETEQLEARETLIRWGCQVTEVRDRVYFRSIYFREPGGVLYEIATRSPGFTFDESRAELGQALKLPPWEEPHRPAIEANLPVVR